MHFLKSNYLKTYEDNGLIIEVQPRINDELEYMEDKDGLNQKKYNKITISNNSEDSKYRLMLCGKTNPKNLKIGIDKRCTRVLENLEKIENCYVIYEGYVKKTTTIIHTIRMWNISSNKVKVNYTLKVENTK